MTSSASLAEPNQIYRESDGVYAFLNGDADSLFEIKNGDILKTEIVGLAQKAQDVLGVTANIQYRFCVNNAYVVVLPYVRTSEKTQYALLVYERTDNDTATFSTDLSSTMNTTDAVTDLYRDILCISDDHKIFYYASLSTNATFKIYDLMSSSEKSLTVSSGLTIPVKATFAKDGLLYATLENSIGYIDPQQATLSYTKLAEGTDTQTWFSLGKATLSKGIITKLTTHVSVAHDKSVDNKIALSMSDIPERTGVGLLLTEGNVEGFTLATDSEGNVLRNANIYEDSDKFFKTGFKVSVPESTNGAI